MKHIYKQATLSMLLLMQVTTQGAMAQKVRIVTISNPLKEPRKDELVVLQRSALEKKLGVISDGHFLSVRTNNNLAVVVQHDDLNGDGKWDEAVFLYSFGPEQKAQFKLGVTTSSNRDPAATRAHVRLKKKAADDSFGPSMIKEKMPLQNPPTDFARQPLPLYLTEGPGWENDKVAFRLYFDLRNGKDIFAKRTARMVLDSVGTKVHPSYHELQDWGMDVLHTGKSLGSGAMALWVTLKNGKDTLMRLGGANIKQTIYQQLGDGPIRALFRINYEWNVEGSPVHIEEQTSIWGGQYFYESKVRVKGTPTGSKLVTGIANFFDNVFQSFFAGDAQVFFSHGRQSENKDYLGMAIVVPQRNFAFAGSTPGAASEILNSYIVAQNILPGQWCSYRFYAGWEKTEAQFASSGYFKKYLQDETLKISNPVQIKW